MGNVSIIANNTDHVCGQCRDVIVFCWCFCLLGSWSVDNLAGKDRSLFHTAKEEGANK